MFHKTGIKPETEWDMLKVLENKDIDAVTIAVPNHWHALATIWSCQAAKHYDESKEDIKRSKHFTNFIDAIRSGIDEDLKCNINEGFYSSALPLLANISCRLERNLRFMGEYEKFANDDEADERLTRIYRKPLVVPDEV